MLDLYDYRRRVFAMYHTIRLQGTNHPNSFDVFRSTRDDLFRSHSQSALDTAQRTAFSGLNYYAYNPDYCVTTQIDTAVEQIEYGSDLDTDGSFRMRRIGQVTFDLPTGHGTLSLFWILGYGGGIFLPFRDMTHQHTTYGGGRYLYDTIKGADLGITGNTITLDFNYAYHPSCHYNPRWVCPLAPPQNRLDFPIYAGEQRYA